MAALSLRQRGFDAIDCVDNIGARLAENNEKRGSFAIRQTERTDRLH